MHWCSWLVLSCQSLCWASVCALLTFRGLANLLTPSPDFHSGRNLTLSDEPTNNDSRNFSDGSERFVGAAALRGRTAGAVMLAVAAAMMVVPPACLIAARCDRIRQPGTNFVLVRQSDLPPSYEEASRAPRFDDRVPEYSLLYGKG